MPKLLHQTQEDISNKYTTRIFLSSARSFHSPTRVMHGMEPLQPFARYVSINLRGGNVSVAQQQLDDTQVGSVVEEVGGERMTQCMGRRQPGYASLAGIAFDQIPECLACHGGTTSGNEQS